jgi:hypothetical protein
LVDGVVHGEVGAIFAIEVSRLARSSMDWHALAVALCRRAPAPNPRADGGGANAARSRSTPTAIMTTVVATT